MSLTNENTKCILEIGLLNDKWCNLKIVSNMSNKPIVDTEILAILNDYHLFLDCEKHVDMPFYVDRVDSNHLGSLKGESVLTANNPLGNTQLVCEVKEKNEYKYTFKILSDSIQSRVLFRMDEGDYAHWNRHLPIPVEQQQVPTPHFHKKGDDGIEFAYRTARLEESSSPLNIHDGFEVFCEESHINHEKIEIQVLEAGQLSFVFEPDPDPLQGVIFP